MDNESWQRILEMEKGSRFPAGIGRIERGECPRGSATPIGCMFCECGHMLECHYPDSCETAECSHYLKEIHDATDNSPEP